MPFLFSNAFALKPGAAAPGPGPGPEPDPSEDPHRYWRILITSRTNNVASISRLELRESEGGPDVAAGFATISLGTWNNIANIFDGNDGTFGWTADTSLFSPSAVGKDFGANEEDWPVIREFMVRNRGDQTQAPGRMSVQYSDDNSTWHIAWNTSNADFGVGETKVFTKGDPVVLDIQNPPTDAGQFGLTFTPNGDATVTGGRFVFDGTGDYYVATGVGAPAHLAYQMTLEVDAVLKSGGTDFNGILVLGDGSERLLIGEQSGTVYVYDDAGLRLQSTGAVLSSGTPVDIKVVINGLDLALYIDDVEHDTFTVSATTQMMGIGFTSNIHLGSDPASLSARSYQGSFAGVRISHDVR